MYSVGINCMKNLVMLAMGGMLFAAGNQGAEPAQGAGKGAGQGNTLIIDLN